VVDEFVAGIVWMPGAMVVGMCLSHLSWLTLFLHSMVALAHGHRSDIILGLGNTIFATARKLNASVRAVFWREKCTLV
jgi:hypothetical protein